MYHIYSYGYDMIRISEQVPEGPIKINTLAQQRFSYACAMIVNDVLDPLCQALLHDISIPNPETTLFFHSIKIDPVERMTDALFDILQHKDADHAAVTKLIHESMEKEAAIFEETEMENNKI